MARRGAYAKGIAKRDEILTRALEVIAQEGYDGASVKQLAAAVELSEAGLLHYFGSKDELFTAILRKRDEADAPQLIAEAQGARALTIDEIREIYIGVVRHNSEVPGLVQLFSRVATDACDPAHPAHEYFTQRSAGLRATIAGAIERAQAEGAIAPDVDAEALARLFQAASDGLQLQWMLDPDVDMAATVDVLFTALIGARRAPAAEGGGD